MNDPKFTVSNEFDKALIHDFVNAALYYINKKSSII